MAESGSLTGTSVRTGLMQHALSKSLSRLERHLGGASRHSSNNTRNCVSTSRAASTSSREKLVILLDQIADQPLSIVGNSGVGTEFRSASASCQRRRGQRSHADLNVCTDTGVQSDRSIQIEDPCNQGRVRTRFPKLTH
ncbi:MAG: hypothetical protein IPG25_12460 [Proteobacteria bacterium]|nr:hypothetical protein [Pseudomonadota bacterium]